MCVGSMGRNLLAVNRRSSMKPAIGVVDQKAGPPIIPIGMTLVQKALLEPFGSLLARGSMHTMSSRVSSLLDPYQSYAIRPLYSLKGSRRGPVTLRSARRQSTRHAGQPEIKVCPISRVGIIKEL